MNKFKLIPLLFPMLILSGCSSDMSNSTMQPAAMQSGNAYTTGVLYLKRGNVAKAKEQLAIAAKNGHTKAQILLANILIFEKGDGEAERLDEAYQLLQQPLAKNDPQAVFLMYHYYQKKHDSANSKIWLDKALALNVPAAYHAKALQLKDNKKQYPQFMANLKKSALLGYDRARLLLGLEYLKKNDLANAYAWFDMSRYGGGLEQKTKAIINKKLENYKASLTESEKIAFTKKTAQLRKEIADFRAKNKIKQ